MDLGRYIGFNENGEGLTKKQLINQINLKLAVNNLPVYEEEADLSFFESASDLLKRGMSNSRLLSGHLCPIDQRIQNFINKHLKDIVKKDTIRVPSSMIDLDRHGLARGMSLAPDQNKYTSEYVSSYKIPQGVLHNPRNDRRTTKGVFHVAEGGLAIAEDKTAVPKAVFAKMLEEAFRPPEKMLEIPFTSTQKKKAKAFVSLVLRPIVCPEVPNIMPQKKMEIRFIAPGSLVSNLDFVESIFGNSGDPHLPENDAGLDVDGFSGHTGMVVLAPHLSKLTKKELGLPEYKKASERQRAQGMCWKKPKEFYNGGEAFKITCRTEDGVILTIIADNYFGYSKKEVKTQIGFAANMMGLTEEEHAGGAMAFASRRLPEVFKEIDFKLYKNNPKAIYKFSDVKKNYKDRIEFYGQGYGRDKKHSNVYYVPEDSEFNLAKQSITWKSSNKKNSLKLLPGNHYIYPSGFKVRMEQHPLGYYWRLLGTRPEGTFIHKPSTVSGGGKSEISKSIQNSMIFKSFFIKDLDKDIETIRAVLKKDVTKRFKDYDPKRKVIAGRPILSTKRSLGSVIKLLTPSDLYKEEYNNWLEEIPNHIRSMIFIIKYHEAHIGKNWETAFSVDNIDGLPGNELKFKNNRQVASSYLRVGLGAKEDWRIFQLRPDFIEAQKLQLEDDITASITVPSAEVANLDKDIFNKSVKITGNCEYRFFQRPDDAIVKGFDVQAENDLAGEDTFISNFEPLTNKDAQEMMEDVVEFMQFTKPMKDIISKAAKMKDGEYFMNSAMPRIVDGKPSKNVRYLQTKQALTDPIEKYIGEMGIRLQRKLDTNETVVHAVNSVIPGRRLNPEDKKAKVGNLAVYNPIHYQELPELFMDFISSLTGKSPSTTGAGSEGALTKGPFNALLPVFDVNNSLLSYILTSYRGFSTAANFIGNIQVDHDVSVLIPEIWCRMTSSERDPEVLIKDGSFEKIEDFTYKGKKVLASRLGYRMTDHFAQLYLGRIFNNPTAVFNEALLKPETQGLKEFVDGINTIVESQKAIAENYFKDGSVDLACPPLKALLHIMYHGHYEGLKQDSPEFRKMFQRDEVLKSDWYNERLLTQQQNDLKQWTQKIKYMEEFLAEKRNIGVSTYLDIKGRLASAKKSAKKVQSIKYLKSLKGTIGSQPM